MIQSILEFIEDNSTAISIVTNVFVGIAGFFANKGWERIKQARTISDLRLLKGRNCKIVLPTYTNIDLSPKHRTPILFNVNEQGDVLASLNIISFVRKLGLQFDEEYYAVRERSNQVIADNNVFCIGGLTANEQTKVYFSRFFPNFRIFNKNLKMNDKEGQKIYIYDETKRGFCWGEGKEFTVSAEEHYAILVRLTKEDFDIEDAGTVYILYGNKAESTLSASKYFLCQMKDMIKRTKRRKHFFIVMRIQEANGILTPYFDKDYDLTDEMFPKNSERKLKI